MSPHTKVWHLGKGVSSAGGTLQPRALSSSASRLTWNLGAQPESACSPCAAATQTRPSSPGLRPFAGDLLANRAALRKEKRPEKGTVPESASLLLADKQGPAVR